MNFKENKEVNNMELPDGYRLSDVFKVEMRNLLGKDADRFLRSMQESPVPSIRFNRRKIENVAVDNLHKVADVKGEDMRRVKWCDGGYYLADRPIYTLNPYLHAGLFYVQDASSMIHQEIIRRLKETSLVSDDAVVLDACAAPGGKTTAMVNELGDDGVVVSNEFDSRRCGIMRENLAKWGFINSIVTQGDTSAFRNVRNMFDVVAVDAPCSGEGMMRKEEEACRQWSLRLVDSCAELQREILENVVGSLKPGGILIYSTCTFNRKENEDIVEYLVAEHGFESIDLKLSEDFGIGKGIETECACARFMPHITQGEGQFVAVLRKPSEAQSAEVFQYGYDMEEIGRLESGKRIKKGKKQNIKNEKGGKTGDKDLLEECRKWIDKSLLINSETVVRGDYVEFRTSRVKKIADALNGKVKIMSAGVEIGKIKGKFVIPTAALAMSGIYDSDVFPILDVDKENALSYLRHESLATPDSLPKGYVVVTYCGAPLGFIKNVGGRGNNLYPTNRKIRMDIKR